MKYHYLVVDQRLKQWNHLTEDFPITPEQAIRLVANGAHDIIEITNPAEPRSLVLHQEN